MPEDNRYADNRLSYLSEKSNEDSQRSSQHGTIKRLVCCYLEEYATKKHEIYTINEYIFLKVQNVVTWP